MSDPAIDDSLIYRSAIPKYIKKGRTSSKQNAESSSYSAGQSIFINMPKADLVDFTNSFLRFDHSITTSATITNTVEVVTASCLKATDASATNPTAGFYRIGFNGYGQDQSVIGLDLESTNRYFYTQPLAFDAVLATIQAAVTALPNVGTSPGGQPNIVVTLSAGTGFNNGNLIFTFDNSTTDGLYRNRGLADAGILIKVEPVSGFIAGAGVVCIPQVAVTTAGSPSIRTGLFPRASKCIASIFDYITVYVGSQKIEDVQGYGLLHSAFNEIFSSAEGMQGRLNMLEGESDAIDRFSNRTGMRYSLRLILGSLKQVIPLNLIRDQLRIELKLVSNLNQVLENGNTTDTLSHTISNVEFHYETLEVDPGYYNALQSQIKSSGQIAIPFHTHSWNQQTVSGTTATPILPFSFKRLVGLWFIQRDPTLVNTVTTLEKFKNYFFNNLDNYRWKIKNQYYPQDAVSALDPQSRANAVESLEYLFRLINTDRDQELAALYNKKFVINNRNSLQGKFIAAFCINSTSFNGVNPNAANQLLAFSGIDTTGAGNQITLELRYTSSVSSTQIDNYCGHQDSLIIKADGSVILDQ